MCLSNRQAISTDEGADYIAADVTMTGLADGTGGYTGPRHLAVSALWFVWFEGAGGAEIKCHGESSRLFAKHAYNLKTVRLSLNQIPPDPRKARPWLRQSKDVGLAGLDVDHSWILKGAQLLFGILVCALFRARLL